MLSIANRRLFDVWAQCKFTGIYSIPECTPVPLFTWFEDTVEGEGPLSQIWTALRVINEFKFRLEYFATMQHYCTVSADINSTTYARLFAEVVVVQVRQVNKCGAKSIPSA